MKDTAGTRCQCEIRPQVSEVFAEAPVGENETKRAISWILPSIRLLYRIQSFVTSLTMIDRALCMNIDPR